MPSSLNPSPRSKGDSILVGLTLVLAAATGCGSAATSATTDIQGLAWPPAEPRVRLERVLEPRLSPGGRAGRFFRRLAGKTEEAGLERPYAVAWDGDDLLLTDPGRSSVVRVSAGGKVTAVHRGELVSPIGVAVCPEGIVVSDSRTGRVILLDRQLRPIAAIGEALERPTGVACSGDQVLVVETGRHRVVRFEPGAGETGAVSAWETASFGDRGDGVGEFNFPTTIAIADGALWVGDTLNFRLQRFDAATGRFRDEFGALGDAPGEMPRVKGMAVDPRGHLWVSDAFLDQISLYDTEGRFLMGLGGHGSTPGRFSFPVGIAAHPDGRVAVVDSLNRRVQIFRLLGEKSPAEAR